MANYNVLQNPDGTLKWWLGDANTCLFEPEPNTFDSDHACLESILIHKCDPATEPALSRSPIMDCRGEHPRRVELPLAH